MDYRRMYDDASLLYSYDLEDYNGQDVILQIESVRGDELTGHRGRKSKKPHVKFAGLDKRLALNKTNGKAIAKMYGKNADEWAGKFVALFVTTTENPDGEQVDCIRIRNKIPEQRAKNGKQGRRAGSLSAEQLVSMYEECGTDERLAELKAIRGQAWDSLSAPQREAVAAAVAAAKARIDAAVPPEPSGSELPK